MKVVVFIKNFMNTTLNINKKIMLAISRNSKFTNSIIYGLGVRKEATCAIK